MTDVCGVRHALLSQSPSPKCESRHGSLWPNLHGALPVSPHPGDFIQFCKQRVTLFSAHLVQAQSDHSGPHCVESARLWETQQ